ncbi:MAG TPA: histidine kinase, partial [Acidimicrobiales bacterium]|nr:histidine kinase [Acidimicrobiales bacterium]
LALFLEQLPLPGRAGPVFFTAGLVGGSMTGVLAGATALAVSGPDLSRLVRSLIVGMVITTALVLGLGPALFFNPVQNGCFECATNLVLLHSDPGLYNGLVQVGTAVAALACACLGFLALRRASRLRALLSEPNGVLQLGGAAVAVLGAALLAYDAEESTLVIDATTRALWLAQCAVLFAASVGFALSVLRARYLAERVASIVLRSQPSPGRLRDALAATLGDPSLEIVYTRPDGGLIYADGRAAPPAAAGVAIASVTRHGNVVAQLRHALVLARSPERVAQAVSGAGLALEHAWLQARLEAELAELAASRARIIEVGDLERQRLERNLHDGAQQRLIALSMALSLLHGDGARIQQARARLQEALDNLRAIAHGIHPVSLSEAGLAGATRELAEGALVPLRVETLAHRDRPLVVDAALYRVVAECIALAERSGRLAPVTVRIGGRETEARVEISTVGVDPSEAQAALQHVADRLAALSGELATTHNGDELVVEAKVPCG